MPKEKKETLEADQCKGGLSFHCKKGPYRWGEEKWFDYHNRGKPYYCRNCKTYMGCSKCAQIPQEVVCLRCKDWALIEGEKEHGKMIRDREKGIEAFRIVSMVASRSMTKAEGLKLVSELFDKEIPLNY